jgi:hypothetical protein
VQAEAGDARAALARERGQRLDVDAVSDSEHALASAAGRRDAAGDRGAADRSELRFGFGERVGFA